MAIRNVEEFDRGSATSTGGVTGSSRVTHGSGENKHFYQLKPSIKDNHLDRKLKVRLTDSFGVTDRENIGEVLAAALGRAIIPDADGGDTPLVPEVDPVYDEENARVLVASRYLVSHGAEKPFDKPMTLDEYAKTLGANFKKHAKLSFDPDDDEHPNVAVITDPRAKQDLANAIALSILAGDHDINPGNMMVIKDKEGNVRVARIDFGHGFGDLTRREKSTSENSVIDYINREELAGIGAARKPKLWRDYMGIIPSEEMARAFAELSSPERLQAAKDAITEQQITFSKLLEKAKTPEEKSHIMRTLASIAKNQGLDITQSNLEPHDVAIKVIFNQMKLSISKNMRDMRDAAKLMELQSKIDAHIKRTGKPPEESFLASIVKEYNALPTRVKGTWFKSDREHAAFKGDLDAYFDHRVSLLQKSHIEHKETKYVKRVSDFDRGSATSTGGVTGSMRVTHGRGDHKHFYQLKPSIKSNSFSRRAKVKVTDSFGVTDRENIGEVLSAAIGKAIIPDADNGETPLVPEVDLVYDQPNKRVLVASRYLVSHGTEEPFDKPMTLDAYAKSLGASFKKHAKLSFDPDDKKTPDVAVITEPSAKQDLANAIALSILVGDHDINPGNMMVIKDKDGNVRVARIDFGHGFGDLTRREQSTSTNSVIDYINREELAGIGAARKPKLWRDYMGIIPSAEMAKAFEALSNPEKLKAAQEAINEQEKHFRELLDISSTQAEKNHIIRTLASIAKNQGLNISKTELKNPEEAMQSIFGQMRESINQNMQDMKAAAELMKLQADINTHIKASGGKPNAKQLISFKKRYNEIPKALQGTWFKSDREHPAFKGGLGAYIAHTIKSNRKPLPVAEELKDKSINNTFKNIIQKLDENGLKVKVSIQKSIAMRFLGASPPKSVSIVDRSGNEIGTIKVDAGDITIETNQNRPLEGITASPEVASPTDHPADEVVHTARHEHEVVSPPPVDKTPSFGPLSFDEPEMTELTGSRGITYHQDLEKERQGKLSSSAPAVGIRASVIASRPSCTSPARQDRNMPPRQP